MPTFNTFFVPADVLAVPLAAAAVVLFWEQPAKASILTAIAAQSIIDNVLFTLFMKIPLSFKNRFFFLLKLR